ncbi:MAG: tetratricopeptide repeat protein [Elusimicrobia bacterium]|nr:tetratricopeptide repeat protein [Elusimicrobiota bacterium]
MNWDDGKFIVDNPSFRGLGYAQAHNNLGAVLMSQGRTDEAMRHFAEAVRLKPDYGLAQANLQAARERWRRGR